MACKELSGEIRPISDEEVWGKLLDEWLQKELSKCYFEVEIFKLHEKYYCYCYTLWVLKNLETFVKRPKINFRRKDSPFQKKKVDNRILNSLSDSLKLSSSTSISGLVWKSIWNNYQLWRRWHCLLVKFISLRHPSHIYTKTNLLQKCWLTQMPLWQFQK